MKSYVIALALLLNVAHSLNADPRPNMSEYKADNAATTAAADADAARKKKMAAVDKVVGMLQQLQTTVVEEGEKEAKTYDKFACFCKDTTAEKTEDIRRAEGQQASLSAKIGQLNTQRDETDTRIGELETSIASAEKAKKEEAEQFAKDKEAYERDLADLEAALYGLDGALRELKASKEPSLVQLQQMTEKMRPALLLADAMGLGSLDKQKSPLALLQAPEVPMENYKFHSNDIIGSLEGLLDDFRNEKKAHNENFLKRTKPDHESFQQLQADTLKNLNNEMDKATKKRDDLNSQIAANSAELTTVSAQLLDDQEYLKTLAKMCSDTAVTYDQRSQTRQDEVSALTATINILKGTVTDKTTADTVRLVQQTASVRRAESIAHDPASMEALEDAAEAADAGVAFFQTEQLRRHLRGIVSHSGVDGREVVAELLENKGRLLKSSVLTSLASAIKADPFAKVKVLIQELIERLQHEAAKDADQKGWCTKATADAEQKRTYAAQEVETLNAAMAELEAKRDQLAEDLDVLNREMTDIRTEVNETVTARNDEKAENAETVETAKAGLDAVGQAIEIMTKFYATAAKASVDLSLLSASPGDDAPGAGFKIGEAYTGAQGGSSGIVGMLEVIQSDFQRTIQETTQAEAQAERDHLKFMTETGMSLAEKDTVAKAKTGYKADADEKLSEASASLTQQTDSLNTAVKELMELKKACVDTGMSYEERVARRKDEIAALNKAACILSAYEKYGPDGAADEC